METRRRIEVKLWQVLVVLILLVLLCVLYRSFSRPSGSQEEYHQTSSNIKEVDGKRYSYNHNLVNILFLGIDQSDIIEIKDLPGRAGQSDTIILFSFNKETKEVTALEIPRDTMAEIDLYGADGNRFSSITAQITAQYAYGNGAESSCWATKSAVSRLLGDLPIDGYISLSVDAIGECTELLGGIEVTVPSDYSSIRKEWTKGAEISLAGEEAEAYVRYRDINAFGSAMVRMERQKSFVDALIRTMREQAKESEFEELLGEMSPYLLSDMDLTAWEQFLTYEFTSKNFITLPGTLKQGNVYEEYYVDEEAMNKLLIDTFYVVEE